MLQLKYALWQCDKKNPVRVYARSRPAASHHHEAPTVAYMTIWIVSPIASSGWSKMVNINKKWWYKLKICVSFWENATFVFWQCQGSWFWVWKKISITIFHKNNCHFLWLLLFCPYSTQTEHLRHFGVVSSNPNKLFLTHRLLICTTIFYLCLSFWTI